MNIYIIDEEIISHVFVSDKLDSFKMIFEEPPALTLEKYKGTIGQYPQDPENLLRRVSKLL